MKKTIIGAFILAALSACGSNSKIVIPSYSAPKEWHKIEALKHGGNSESYLSFAINPELIDYPKSLNYSKQKVLVDELVKQTKAQLTDVRFITIEPIYEDATVKLDFGIDAYSYTESSKERRAFLKTTFTLSKNTSPILIKNYSEKEFRYSKDGYDLPTQQEIISSLTESVVKQFISDISPTKTNQLREFLPLPSKLSHVLNAAKRGNYDSAINDMESYSSDHDVNYYYNLAVLYEAKASQKEDIAYAEKAMEAYNQSIKNGGESVKLVTNAKSRFEKYYRLLKIIKAQRSQNEQRKGDFDSLLLR